MRLTGLLLVGKVSSGPILLQPDVCVNAGKEGGLPHNPRTKGHGRAELRETGRSVTPRRLDRRVGRWTRKGWLSLSVLRFFLSGATQRNAPDLLG